MQEIKKIEKIKKILTPWPEGGERKLPDMLPDWNLIRQSPPNWSFQMQNECKIIKR